MNRKFKLMLTTALLSLLATAAPALAPFENLVEITLDKVSLPAHEVDQVRIQRCMECEPLRLKVSPATEYRVGGFDSPTMTLQEFRAALRQSGRANDVLMYVGYIHDTFEVRRIVVAASAE